MPIGGVLKEEIWSTYSLLGAPNHAVCRAKRASGEKAVVLPAVQSRIATRLKSVLTQCGKHTIHKPIASSPNCTQPDRSQGYAEKYSALKTK